MKSRAEDDKKSRPLVRVNEHFSNALEKIRVALVGRAATGTKSALPSPTRVCGGLVFSWVRLQQQQERRCQVPVDFTETTLKATLSSLISNCPGVSLRAP